MKKKFFYLIIVFFLKNIVSAQEIIYQDSLYKRAVFFLEQENYKNAIVLFLDLEKNYKNVFDLNNKIAYCYLNIPYKKEKAIPYLENAVKNFALQYNENQNIKINKEIVNTYLLLSKAYQLNYQFTGAIFTLKDIQSMLKKKKKYPEIDREIEICNNAIRLTKKIIDVNINNYKAVNSSSSERNFLLSSNENYIFFNSDYKNKNKIYQYFFKHHTIKRRKNSFKNITDLKIDEKITGISPNGNEILLVKKDKKNNFNIYISNFEKDEWSKPKKLGKNINSKYDEIFASFSPDGKYLFFVSNKKGGFGGFDIYISERKDNLKFARSKNLGKNINTIYDENSPFLYKNTNTLFFSSKGHETIGNFDIFFSDWQNKTWTNPVNLGYPINSPEDELNFILDNKGQRGYFDSQRKGGKGNFDIFEINFLKSKIEKEKLIILEGYFLQSDAKVNPNMQLTITNDNFDIIGLFKPNQKTGKYFCILNSDRNYHFTYVSSKNFTHHLDFNFPVDSAFKEVQRPIKIGALVIDKRNNILSPNQSKDILKKLNYKKENLTKIQTEYKNFSETKVLDKSLIGKKIILNDISFVRSKTILLKSSYPQLDKLITLLKKYPLAEIEISGHAGSLGNSLELSKMRAKAVSNYLIIKGINKDRLKTKAYGDKYPIASEETEEGREKNRRVEFKILKV